MYLSIHELQFSTLLGLTDLSVDRPGRIPPPFPPPSPRSAQAGFFIQRGTSPEAAMIPGGLIHRRSETMNRLSA